MLHGKIDRVRSLLLVLDILSLSCPMCPIHSQYYTKEMEGLWKRALGRLQVHLISDENSK